MRDKEFKQEIDTWWIGLPRYRGGMPAKGSVAGALIVLDRLKEKYVLDLDSLRTPGKSQLSGVSGTAVQSILARYGENRPFLSEGGRTNRGLAGDISAMLEMLERQQLDSLASKERNIYLDEFQTYLVEKIREYFNLERLKFVYNPTKTTWQVIHELVLEARESGKGGPVAEHLVGAKLQLRYPETKIEPHSSSAADESSGRPGDFLINDTAFHVTISPSPGHYQRCKDNLERGYRPFLLVPDDTLAGTRQNANQEDAGKIAVESIESFVAQNVEEISQFTKGKIILSFRRLLEIYNERVDAVEMDKSLLIEIPVNLR